MTTMSDSPEIELLHRAWEAQAYLANREAPVAPMLPPPPANHNHFGGE
jgi:hypothetical protein